MDERKDAGEGPFYTSVPIKELGRNCWQQCGNGRTRCKRVFKCHYPEKKTCMAVHAEIEYLKARVEREQQSTNKQIKELLKGSQ